METSERLVEIGGGVGDLFAVWLGSLDDLIERFYLFGEVRIRFCQFFGDVLQTGFLNGRKRGEKILAASSNFFNGLIEGGCAVGQRRRSENFLQRFAKSLYLCAGGLGALYETGERGALLSASSDGHGAVKVLEIVLFAYPAGTPAAARRAVSAATTAAVLGKRSAGTGEQRDSDNQYGDTGHRSITCRHAKCGNTVGRYARTASSFVQHRPDLQEHCTVGTRRRTNEVT